MDTEYIARKVWQCKALVENATSEAQKEIYQEYLEFWQEKIPKSNEKPDAETNEEAGNLLITEEVFNADAEIIEETITEILEDAKKISIPEVIKEEEIIDIIEPELEALQAELFEATYPNKRAYLRRNGDLIKTKAFKEFLISKE